jgi:hypothetical protein
MDWFERLAGFRECSYEETRSKLNVDGDRLLSLANGRSYGVGEFELASLQTLRDRAKSSIVASGRLKASVVRGDVRQMHRAPEYEGALFQVASQFNALEMIGPNVTPEGGVTRYEGDRTQGPARRSGVIISCPSPAASARRANVNSTVLPQSAKR